MRVLTFIYIVFMLWAPKGGHGLRITFTCLDDIIDELLSG